MSRSAWMFILALLPASLGVGCGGSGPRADTSARDLRDVQHQVPYGIFWAGSTLDGLSLAKVLRAPGSTTLIYGGCAPRPTGDGAGCTPPLEIEVSSLCDRNALVLDVRPSSRRVSRGASVLTYGDGRRELAAGDSNVVISARPSVARRALAALRPVDHRWQASLPSARYPRYYIAQLRRVFDVYRRGGADAVRRRLGISRSAALFEFDLARGLGAARLRRVRGSSPTLVQVKQDRLAAELVGVQGERSAARALGMSLRQLRASAQRRRDRSRGCPLEPLR